MPVVKRHLVFESSNPDARYLDAEFEQVPGFAGNYSRAIRQVVRIVHSIPNSYLGAPLSEVEIYIGRSTKAGVLGRFKYGHRRRGHVAGTIAIRAKTAYLERLETAGIAVLRELRAAGLLCVANVHWDSRGRQSLPSNEGCVYVTWGIVPPGVLQAPNKRSLRDVARAVKARTGGLVGVGDVFAGLEGILGRRYNYLEDI